MKNKFSFPDTHIHKRKKFCHKSRIGLFFSLRARERIIISLSQHEALLLFPFGVAVFENIVSDISERVENVVIKSVFLRRIELLGRWVFGVMITTAETLVKYLAGFIYQQSIIFVIAYQKF